jgi:predicted nuclease with TOPRIM domain
MKKILLAALLLPAIAFGQTISVEEEMVAIDGMSRNSLTVMIPEASSDDVKKAWKKKLKDLKGKVSDKTIIFGDDCEDKSMGDNTFDVYSVVEEATDEGVRLVVAFDLGGAYLNTKEHPDQYPAAQKIVSGFAVEQAKEAVKAEIDEVENVLKDVEKDLSGLEKDKKKLEKDIKDYEKKIEEAKAEIEKNVAAQANKTTEIEGLKSSIIDLEKKMKSIK